VEADAASVFLCGKSN